VNPKKAIQQPWLSLARAAWIAMTLFNLLPGLIGIPDYFRQLVALDPWPNQPGWTQAAFSTSVAQAGAAPQVVAWIILIPALIKILVCLSLGLLIFWRKSDEWQGLLVSFVLVGLCGTFIGGHYDFLTVLPQVWQVVGQEIGLMIWLAFFMFLILFPDGRFLPHWMRWIGVGLAIWFVLTEIINNVLGQTPDWIWWFGFVFLAFILLGKVTRYRYLSNPVERLQIRWFLFAILAFSLHGVLQFIFVRVFPISIQPGSLELLTYLVGIYLSDLIFLLIPISIAVAIFRYHLWDIDLIIRRTLAYAVLSASLAVVFLSSISLFQMGFTAVSGQRSAVATVLSTLLIAALFSPLLRRIQNGIDRRFFRKKYDAGKTMADFSAGLRQEVNLSEMNDRMLAVVQETLQPEMLSLWLKAATRSQRNKPNRDGLQ
jgi:hypothetical protein